MTKRLVCLFVLLALALAAEAKSPAAKPYRLAPYKDDLFGYASILDTQYDSDFLLVEYNRPRDLYARDVEVGTRVDPKYVSLDTLAVESELTLDVDGHAIAYSGVGKTGGGAKAVVIFLHGLGTGRATGVNDWIHGGNFNRIKNLMMRNEGVYISPSFSDFGKKGGAEIKALVLEEARLSPGAPIFLACASAGGNICWRLLLDPEVKPILGGLVFLDAPIDTGYLKIAASLGPAERVPIHISGSKEDAIVGWKSQLKFFRDMKAAIPDYPIRFVLFTAGTHGISLRMTDWRVTLNWMLGFRQAQQAR
jgi:pimeloyl-ACP methyl ester carboxylesterase